MLQLMELGNIGILMPSAEYMGLYRGGLLSTRSELDAMGGMPLGVLCQSIPRILPISVDPFF